MTPAICSPPPAAASRRPGAAVSAYTKAGVILDDLRAREDAPATLFERPRAQSAALMAAIDGLNARYGRHAIFPAAMGIERPWKLRAEHHSPRYTTRLDDLPTVQA